MLLLFFILTQSGFNQLQVLSNAWEKLIGPPENLVDCLHPPARSDENLKLFPLKITQDVSVQFSFRGLFHVEEYL